MADFGGSSSSVAVFFQFSVYTNSILRIKKLDHHHQNCVWYAWKYQNFSGKWRFSVFRVETLNPEKLKEKLGRYHHKCACYTVPKSSILPHPIGVFSIYSPWRANLNFTSPLNKHKKSPPPTLKKIRNVCSTSKTWDIAFVYMYILMEENFHF